MWVSSISVSFVEEDMLFSLNGHGILAKIQLASTYEFKYFISVIPFHNVGKKEESSYCFSLTTGEIEAEKLTILMIKISSICYFLCAKPCWQRSTSMNSELHNNSTE